MTVNTFHIESTHQGRTYSAAPSHDGGDERIRQRYFTYQTDKGLVAGVSVNVLFTLQRPARVVWPIISDFNVWQNLGTAHSYSGILRELEGKSFGLHVGPNDRRPHYYEVVKVIPEYLIVINQPIPADGSSAGYPGKGGVSPGFHVFMLNEHEGRTTVSIYMEHSAIADSADAEEALAPWRESRAPAYLSKWRDEFIPSLKNLVAAAG